MAATWRLWTMTCAVIAVFAASARCGAQDVQAQINEAFRANDWPKVEQLCRQSISQNGPTESTATALANAVMRQKRCDEALKIGRDAYRLFPTVGSAAMYAHTAISAGAYSEARTILRRLKTVEKDWGGAGPWINDLVLMASTKVFRLTYTIPAEQAPKDREFWIPIPLTTVNQHLVDIKVTGAETVRTQTDVHGNNVRVVKAAGGEPVVVLLDVSIKPYNSSELMRKADGKKPGPELARYLGKTVGASPDKTIDPQAPEVQQIVKGFPAGSPVARAESMMAWVNKHLTYCPPGSPPGLDDSTDVLKRGGGHCEALTQAEVAIARACGIPARLIRGQSAVGAKIPKSTQHTILQLWISGVGWTDWDHNQRPWENRDGFIRLWTYEAANEPLVAKLWEFHGITFQALKGYKHELLSASLD